MYILNQKQINKKYCYLLFKDELISKILLKKSVLQKALKIRVPTFAKIRFKIKKKKKKQIKQNTNVKQLQQQHTIHLSLNKQMHIFIIIKTLT